MKYGYFKVRFSRTSKKAERISKKGPQMWYGLCTDVKLINSIDLFLTYKGLLANKSNEFLF